MANDFLKKIIKDTGNEYASVVEDGVKLVMWTLLLTLALSFLMVCCQAL